MFKYAVVKCKDCGLEMDLRPFMTDLVPFGIMAICRSCRRPKYLECFCVDDDLSDYFVEDDLPF